MKFQNPANDHTQTVLGPLHWLWCFLVPPIYYAIKGIWPHAIGSFLIAWLIGVPVSILFLGLPIPQLIIGLIYAFMNKSIVRNHYLARGWVEVKT